KQDPKDNKVKITRLSIMLASLKQKAAPLSEPGRITHVLVIVPVQYLSKKSLDKVGFLGRDQLKSLLSRRSMEPGEIGHTPVSANLASGALCAWSPVDTHKSPFEQHTSMRKALQLLLDEKPSEIHLAVYGDQDERHSFAQLGIYTAWVNGTALPLRKTSKKEAEKRSLARIVLHGYK